MVTETADGVKNTIVSRCWISASGNKVLDTVDTVSFDSVVVASVPEMMLMFVMVRGHLGGSGRTLGFVGEDGELFLKSIPGHLSEENMRILASVKRKNRLSVLRITFG